MGRVNVEVFGDSTLVGESRQLAVYATTRRARGCSGTARMSGGGGRPKAIRRAAYEPPKPSPSRLAMYVSERFGLAICPAGGG